MTTQKTNEEIIEKISMITAKELSKAYDEGFLAGRKQALESKDQKHKEQKKEVLEKIDKFEWGWAEDMSLNAEQRKAGEFCINKIKDYIQLI